MIPGADQNELSSVEMWKRRVTSLAMGVALLLILAKLAAWVLSGSVAILASLADSGLDLLSSFSAFAAVRIAATPPDDNHRFGHQKAEAVSALLQTSVIAASATLVTLESIGRLFDPQAIDRVDVAIGALSLSVVLTICLVAVQTLAVRHTDSLVLKADRAHYVGDVLANAGALLAVVLATQFGFLRADAIAGLFASGFLFWSVKVVASQALPELMDEELPDSERVQIAHIIDQDPDVVSYHGLRTRRAGPSRFIQVDLELPGSMSLKDAHMVSNRVTAAMQQVFPGADIMVHKDAAEEP
ncbi:MAG: cation diffusion facilitator family transporter [Pseudomonadota bacterium]